MMALLFMLFSCGPRCPGNDKPGDYCFLDTGQDPSDNFPSWAHGSNAHIEPDSESSGRITITFELDGERYRAVYSYVVPRP